MSSLDNLKGKGVESTIDTKLGTLGMEIENLQHNLGIRRAIVEEQRLLLTETKLKNPDNHTYINDLIAVLNAQEQAYESDLKVYNLALKAYRRKVSHSEVRND